jgi:hypothetical protein
MGWKGGGGHGPAQSSRGRERPSSPCRQGAPAHPRHGHCGRSQRGGSGCTGLPLGEVRLGVRDEHHQGGGHSPGNAREQTAHRDGGTAWRRRRRPNAAVVRGTVCGSNVPYISRKKRGEEAGSHLRVEGLEGGSHRWTRSVAQLGWNLANGAHRH